VKWNAGDTVPTGGGIQVYAGPGYNGITTINNQVINIGNLTASFSATVTFNPPLPPHAQYTITFSVGTSLGQLSSTTTRVTVP
jgi:hypothetical protein